MSPARLDNFVGTGRGHDQVIVVVTMIAVIGLLCVFRLPGALCDSWLMCVVASHLVVSCGFAQDMDTTRHRRCLALSVAGGWVRVLVYEPHGKEWSSECLWT